MTTGGKTDGLMTAHERGKRAMHDAIVCQYQRAPHDPLSSLTLSAVLQIHGFPAGMAAVVVETLANEYCNEVTAHWQAVFHPTPIELPKPHSWYVGYWLGDLQRETLWGLGIYAAVIVSGLLLGVTR